MREGLTLGSFRFAGYQVEKLYLKLDNRLILKARRLVIPRQKEAAKLGNLPRGLKRLHRVLAWFDEIELEEIDFTNNLYRFIYRDHILYLSSREYEIAGMVYDRGREMEVQIPLLRIPKYHLDLSGELHYRYRDGRIVASGFYHIEELSGNFRVAKEGERIRFRVDSMATSSLRQLLRLITMSSEAREWLEKRVTAGEYRLAWLEGEGHYDRKRGEFVPEIETLRGRIDLKKVKIRFEDGLAPLLAKGARVLIREGNLYFLFDDPSYRGHKLEGSTAALLHLADPARLTLLLRLRYHGRIDWQLLKILAAYGLEIRVGQRSGTADGRVDLDVPLGMGKIRIQGRVRLSAGELEYRKQRLKIGGGELTFTSSLLQIRHLSIREPWLHCRVDGRFDLQKQEGGFTVRVQDLKWGSGEGILHLRDRKFPLILKVEKPGWRMSLPSLESELYKSRKSGWRLEVADLALWRPYLRGMLRLPEGGKLRVESEDGRRLQITGALRWKESFLYGAEGAVTELPFRVNITEKGRILMQALGGKLSYDSVTRTLKIQGLNIDAKRLLDTLKGLPNSSHKEGGFIVLGEKSLIRYGSHVLLTDRYRLEIDGKNLRFEGALGKDRVTLVKQGDVLQVDAPEIGDRMLHALIHFNGLQEGRYSLHAKGSAEKGYKGEIRIHGGVLRDFKAFNDLMAFFNTVPALMAFSSPGFSAKGFELEEGKILFTLKGNLLTIDSLLLRGKSSTVVGQGTVDLQSGRLAIELGIQTARELGKVIGNIPLVGYILFGKDKSLTAGVKIDGSLDHPKIHTNPVGEALLYPLELLKRTLTAPARLATPKQNPVPPTPITPPAVKAPSKDQNTSSGMF